MDRATILRRAAKLAALAADRGSLAEANAAGDALAKLLAEHRLSLADITAAQIEAGIRSEDRPTPWRDLPSWARSLATGIARACDCQVVAQRANTITLVFIGHDADVAVASYWFSVMADRLPRLAEADRNQVERNHLRLVDAAAALGRPYPRRGWSVLRTDYLDAAADQIGIRLLAKLAPAVDAAGSNARALRQMKGTAIAAWMDQHCNLRPGERAPDRHADQAARTAGTAAAAGLTLADGLRHAPGTRPSLTTSRVA